ILCSRAKQPMLETVVDGEKTLVAEPWEPIQDKRLKYEMTIVVPMTLDGGYETDPARLKVAGDIAHLFRGELLDESTGSAIADWVKGKPFDHALELLRRAALEAAAGGTERFTKWWNSPSVRPRRKGLRPDFDNLASIARAADQELAGDREAEVETRQWQRDGQLLDAVREKRASQIAATLARWILSSHAREVHARHVQREVRLSGLGTAGEIEQASAALIALGWLLPPAPAARFGPRARHAYR